MCFLISHPPPVSYEICKNNLFANGGDILFASCKNLISCSGVTPVLATHSGVVGTLVRRTTFNEEVESSSPARVDFFFRSFCRLMAGDRVLEADVRSSPLSTISCQVYLSVRHKLYFYSKPPYNLYKSNSGKLPES